MNLDGAADDAFRKWILCFHAVFEAVTAPADFRRVIS
jgi:hypothetical protein